MYVPTNKTTAGTVAAQAPRKFGDAMYSSVPGAVFDESSSYTLPCDTQLNISMVFGRYVYPIHPIDVVTTGDVNSTTGHVVCNGAFTYTD